MNSGIPRFLCSLFCTKSIIVENGQTVHHNLPKKGEIRASNGHHKPQTKAKIFVETAISGVKSNNKTKEINRVAVAILNQPRIIPFFSMLSNLGHAKRLIVRPFFSAVGPKKICSIPRLINPMPFLSVQTGSGAPPSVCLNAIL